MLAPFHPWPLALSAAAWAEGQHKNSSRFSLCCTPSRHHSSVACAFLLPRMQPQNPCTELQAAAVKGWPEEHCLLVLPEDPLDELSSYLPLGPWQAALPCHV